MKNTPLLGGATAVGHMLSLHQITFLTKADCVTLLNCDALKFDICTHSSTTADALVLAEYTFTYTFCVSEL